MVNDTSGCCVDNDKPDKSMRNRTYLIQAIPLLLCLSIRLILRYEPCGRCDAPTRVAQVQA